METLPLCLFCWSEVIDDEVGDRLICPVCFRQFRTAVLRRIDYTLYFCMVEGVYSEKRNRQKSA